MESNLKVEGIDQTDRLTATESSSDTDWRDPWAATETTRRELASTPTGRAQFLNDLKHVSRRITDEINADPMEVQKLRQARQQARAGQTVPRRGDTKSSS